jgi:NAD(P)-dependent dehydrogenase (short-subunit alcohol dehydrogenase family)
MIANHFSGKVVFITGGTSGIGLATARAFGRAGARVVVGSRNEAAGREACISIEHEGGAALFTRTDVRDEASVKQAVERAVERFGRLDIAVNAAGIGGDMAPLDQTTQEVWDDVMATNARGVWLAMRYEIPAMLAAGGGAIVNLSSVYGAAGKSAHHAYVASKHAVVGVTRSVALEYATRGIRVNALLAGVTATAGMLQAEAAVPQIVRELVAQHPLQRMASEGEIAATVLWLCSDAASYVTGAPIAADGGFLAA